jgi:iron complex outermembrane recepter protein
VKAQALGFIGATMLAAAFPATGQQVDESNQASAGKDVLEEIVSVGTRVKGRTVLESTVPVDVIPASELIKTPQADIKDALMDVSPSYYAHRESNSDQDAFSRENNLRGLDGGEILLLLNGKRVHRSSIVNKLGIQQQNVSTFGTIGLSNVEILRDGASALYGADAVAGVINLVMDSSEGMSVRAGYSEYYKGDGALYTVAGKFGTHFLSDEGFLTVTVSHSSQDPTQRNLPHLDAVAMLADGERRGVTIDIDPLKAQYAGITAQDMTQLTWNAAIPVTDSVEIYTFGNFADISNLQTANYRSNLYCEGGSHHHPGLRPCSDIPELHFPNGSIGSPPSNMNPTQLTLPELQALIGVEAANDYAYLLADGPNATSTNGAAPVGYDPKLAFPAGYTPRITIQGPDFGAYGGVRGELSNGLTWDVSGSFGRSRVDIWNRGTQNSSLGAPMAADGSIDYANVQKNFYNGGLVNIEGGVNADFGYSVKTDSIDALLISFGADYRREHYYNINGEENSWKVGPLSDLAVGANGFTGTPIAALFVSTRSKYAAYVDLDAQVTEALNLTAAVRYEDYSDFGNNTSVKASGRFQLIPDVLAIRGAVSTGFHAPSLGQIDNLQLTTGFFGGTVNYGGVFPASHPLAIALGASPLKAEKARNYSMGFVWTPGDSTDITIDAFQIKLDDRIRLSQRYQASNPAYAPAFQELIDSGFPGAAFLTEARFYGNGLNTTTKGVEVVGTHVMDLFSSQLSLSLAYAYVKTDITKFNPAISDEITNLQTELFSPPHRAVLTGNYVVNDKLNLGMRARLWGAQKVAFGFKNPDGSYIVDQLPSDVFIDISTAYQITDRIRLTIGADNVLDNYPKSVPEKIDPKTNRGIQYWKEGTPYQGGSYYARLDLSF